MLTGEFLKIPVIPIATALKAKMYKMVDKSVEKMQKI